MMSTKFSDFLIPLCPYLYLIFTIQFTEPPLLPPLFHEPPSDADIISRSSQREAKRRGRRHFATKRLWDHLRFKQARERERVALQREAEQRRTSEKEGSRGREERGRECSFQGGGGRGVPLPLWPGREMPSCAAAVKAKPPPPMQDMEGKKEGRK